jgi:DNA-binding transcriptional LysR family regulator
LVASDYTMMILLQRLFQRLAQEAPAVHISVTPFTGSFREQLDREEADLVIVPREVVRESAAGLPGQTLFTDRFVCALHHDHPLVGNRITARELAALPYLATTAGSLPSVADTKLDALGVVRHVEAVTQSFALAPFLLRGTRLVTIIQERLAREVASAAHVRMLEPPVNLGRITQAMFWHPRHSHDPGHQWLREQITGLAARL